MHINNFTLAFCILSILSTLIPKGSLEGTRVCFKAYVGSDLYNYQVCLANVPRTGDSVDIGHWRVRYIATVKGVWWNDDATRAIIAIGSFPIEKVPKLEAAGFVKLVRNDK